jgi:hypothetical protein
MTDEDKKRVIGRGEVLAFPELGLEEVYARIDTGARTSAIWVSKAFEEGSRLGVVFFDESSAHYTGKVHYFDEFSEVMVASSNGNAEARYKIKLLVVLAGKRIRGHFTLADRSTQVYPVLIGRNTLKGKFIVDVKQGAVLRAEEKRRTEALQSRLKRKDVEE